MTTKQNLDHSSHEIELEIDLVEVFGQEVTDPALQYEIGLEAAEIIKDRTKKGEFLNTGADKTYSDPYKDSLPYRAASKTGLVNMKLSGGMLENLQPIDTDAKKITIGFTDSNENAKAYNHNTGDTTPKREFLDLKRDEIAKIKNRYQSRISDAQTESNQDRGRINRFLSFLRGFGF